MQGLSVNPGTCGGAHMMTKLWHAHVALASTVDSVLYSLLRCRRHAQWHTDVRQLLQHVRRDRARRRLLKD